MVAYRSRIARWGEVTFPVSEDEPGARPQDARGLGKAGLLIGDCPYHINTDCAVDARTVETGRIKLAILYEVVMPSRNARARACSSATVGKVDAHELRTCGGSQARVLTNR